MGSDHLAAPLSPSEPALTPLERSAATAHLAGDVTAAVASLESLVTELSGPSGDMARRTLLSKGLVVAHAEATALQALLGRLLGKNPSAAGDVSRILTASTRRMAMLARAHADTSARERRTVLMVGVSQTNTVIVEGA